jgi:predicted DNA-binding transcriptional regulator AlpA
VTAAEAVQAATDAVRRRGWEIGQILAHQPPLMDLRTFAEATGFPESTVYQEAAKGALPIEVVQIGRTKFVRTVDVWRWLGLIGNDDDAGAGTPTPPVQQHLSTSTHK